MAPRPVWVQFDFGSSINSAGTSVVDLLTGLDSLQVGARTIVAIKGQAHLAVSSSSATPDTFECALGFITGVSTLTSADFPDLGSGGLVNPGWMYRHYWAGVTTGDGTNRIQTYNDAVDIDVKSKRSLAGIGRQSLWAVIRTMVAADAGTVFFNGQVLLASKG